MENINYITYNQFEELLNKNKYLLVNLLADGCHHCDNFKKELPKLQEISKKNKVEMVNIKFAEENAPFFEKYASIIDEHKISFPSTFVFVDKKFISWGSGNSIDFYKSIFKNDL